MLCSIPNRNFSPSKKHLGPIINEVFEKVNDNIYSFDCAITSRQIPACLSLDIFPVVFVIK